MKDMSNRRDFVKQLVGASVAPALLRSNASASPEPAQPVKLAAKVKLEPFDYQGVTLLDGMFKDQYHAARDYYFNMSNDDILKGFRTRAGLPAPGKGLEGWSKKDSSPTFGQWLSGMARMSKATGDQAILNKASYLMREWAKTIAPDGTWCYTDHPNHADYVYDKMVCGLVDLYGYGGQKDALPPLEKITDWASARFDRSRHPANAKDISAGRSGAEWYTLSENLYRAYQLTGNTKFRNFGDVWHYNHYWGMYNGSVPVDVHGLHAYSHVNTLSSAAMTYWVTGGPQYLKTITGAYDYLDKTQFYATGGYGPGEQLQAPDGSLGNALVHEPMRVWPSLVGRSFETPCGSWAGFKLSRYLIMFTGDARYGDWTEKLLYNGIGAALPMTQFSIVGTGQTFYYADYRVGGGTKWYFHDAWPCCSGTYIQNMADYHNIIYYKDPSGLYVNLFVPSEVEWNHQGEDVKVTQETAYPESETTTLTVEVAKQTPFTLSFRVPGWSKGVTAEVNGSPANATIQPGSWARIKRTWKSGDKVTIRIPMELAFSAIDPQHPNRVALTKGPVVLVRHDEEVQLPSKKDFANWLKSGADQMEYGSAAESKSRFVPFYKVRYGAPYCMYFDLNT